MHHFGSVCVAPATPCRSMLLHFSPGAPCLSGHSFPLHIAPYDPHHLALSFVLHGTPHICGHSVPLHVALCLSLSLFLIRALLATPYPSIPLSASSCHSVPLHTLNAAACHCVSLHMLHTPSCRFVPLCATPYCYTPLCTLHIAPRRSTSLRAAP